MKFVRLLSSVTTMKKHLKSTLRRLPYGSTLMQVARGPQKAVRFDDPLEAIYSQSHIVFEVPADRCKYTYQFSYGLRGWHPFVRTLLQYLDEPSLTYERSILCKYYSRYQPKVILDLFLEGDDRRKFADSRLAREPIKDHYPCLPWDPKFVPMRGEGGLAVADGLQGFGPVSEEKGEFEFSRLLTTWESILRKGYRPTRDSDGEIRGYFLKRGNDYRFMIRAGFHRAAVLSAMGYDHLRVKFKSDFPRVIDRSDLKNWPLVRQGVVEPEVAEQIFETFFNEDGSGKAKNWGLL